MKRALVVFSAFVALADQGAAQQTSQRNATVPAAGARLVQLSVGPGTLRVQGQPGATAVTVVGEARAPNDELLAAIRLIAEPRGDVIHIESIMPSARSGWHFFSFGEHSPVLNLVITIPAGMAVTATDGSGEAEFRGTGALSVRDGSGSLIVEDVMGEVDIDDGSGELTVGNVTGPVRIKDASGTVRLEGVGRDITVSDGSGEIVIRRVGNVRITSDGSGAIDIQDATGTVRVDSDGSGDINVRNVGGDFVVSRGGSGRIRYDGVRGRVDVPRR